MPLDGNTYLIDKANAGLANNGPFVQEINITYTPKLTISC
jgi:hypothetical protein